jgi:uncharacterized protein
MRILACFVALALGTSGAAWAFKGIGGKDVSSQGTVTIEQIPPASAAMAKPLPELKGVVSWRTLAEVESVRQKESFVPKFSSTISALDKKQVKLQGFMMPLDMGERQKRFILAAMPPSCAFCLPGGPDQIVEVQARTPIKFTFEPMIVSGRMTLLRDDPMGLFYRLTDAVVVSQ